MSDESVIRRSTGERLVGLRTTAILGLLGLLLALFAAAVPGFVLHEALDLSQTVANRVVLSLLLATFVLVCVGIARSHGRRSGSGLRLLPDRIERLRGERVDVLSSQDLERVHVFHDQGGRVERITFRARAGRTLDLRDGEWPVTTIAEAFERVLVPGQLERARTILGAGEPLTFPERPSWGASTIVLAVLGLLTAVGIVFVASSEGLDVKQFLKSGKFVVIAVVGAGAFVERVRRLRGGGITLTRTGVRRAGERADRETPFGELQSVVVEAEGVRLQGANRQYRLSSAGANYAVFLSLLRECAARSAS